MCPLPCLPTTKQSLRRYSSGRRSQCVGTVGSSANEELDRVVALMLLSQLRADPFFAGEGNEQQCTIEAAPRPQHGVEKAAQLVGEAQGNCWLGSCGARSCRVFTLWVRQKKAQTLSRGLGLLLWGSGVHDSPHRRNRGGCNTGNLANSHLAVVAQGQYAIFRNLPTRRAYRHLARRAFCAARMRAMSAGSSEGLGGAKQDG